MMGYYYYYVTSIYYCVSGKTIIKLGITCSPKDRMCTYQTSIYNMRYAVVFKVPCNLEQITEFESSVLEKYKEIQIYNNGYYYEQLYCNDEKLQEIIDYIRVSIPYNFTELSHDTAILEQRTVEKLTDTDKYHNVMHVVEDTFPYKLRGYQLKAYEEMTNILQTGDTAILNILCRCGKTILFQKYVHDNIHEYDFIIYATHRLILIDEINTRWRSIFPELDMYEVSSNTSNTSSNTCSVTRGGINVIPMDSDNPVFISICNKSFGKLYNLNFSDKRVLIIFDEAHNLVTSNLSLTHPLNVLDEMKIKQLKKIFVTATPKYGNYITHKKSIFMNDKKYFGSNNKVMFNNISEAIEQKFMTDMKVIVGEYKSLLNHESIDDPLNKIMSIIKDIEENETLSYKPKKLLMFCNSKNRVDMIYNKLKGNKELDWVVYKLHSGMNDREKIKQMSEFTDNKNKCIMVNCQMISDGINIPSIDSVAFVDPRYNKENVVQIIFRPRTYMTGVEKMAYCIIPITDQEKQEKFDTFFQILDELCNKGDPSAIAFKSFNSDSKKSLGNNLVKEIPGIIIDANLKAALYDYSQRRDKTLDTILDAIYKVLNDYIPRPVVEICKSVQNLMPESSTEECKSELKKMFENKTLGYCKDTDEYYLVKKFKNCNMSLLAFLKNMQEEGITNEQEYLSYIAENPWKEYPDDPVDWGGKYVGFRWIDLYEIDDSIEYYDFEECKNIIEDLLSDSDNLDKLTACKSNNQKMQFLHGINSSIPPTVNAAESRYGKKIYELSCYVRSVGYTRKRNNH